MRMSILVAAALTGLAVSASAQNLSVGNNLFISPCGEPFWADKSQAYPIVNWFNGADANHDGKLDIDEMRADATRFFQALDQNGDGVLDGAEINFYETKVVPQILDRPVGALDPRVVRVQYQQQQQQQQQQQPMKPAPPTYVPPGTLGERQGAVYYSLFREPEPVRSADRNFDYKVSLAEFQAQSDRHFKALDVGNQGYLTLALLPKTDAERSAKAHR